MTNLSWPGFVQYAAAHPGVTALACFALATLAWTAHVWRLRRRERDLMRLVDERTRQWQEALLANAELQRQLDGIAEINGVRSVGEKGGLPSSEETGSADEDDRPTRVLVVDDRPEQRDALTSWFAAYGVRPAFADSQWAAAVAVREAGSQGVPFDFVLVRDGIDEVGRDVSWLTEPGSREEVGRLLGAVNKGAGGALQRPEGGRSGQELAPLQ